MSTTRMDARLLFAKGYSQAEIARLLGVSRSRICRCVHGLPTPARKRATIYFIRVRHYVKVGVTDNLRRRLRTLQAGCPYDMTVVGTVAGSFYDEQRILRRFREFHHRGEWFHLTSGLLRMIRLISAHGL